MALEGDAPASYRRLCRLDGPALDQAATESGSSQVVNVNLLPEQLGASNSRNRVIEEWILLLDGSQVIGADGRQGNPFGLCWRPSLRLHPYDLADLAIDNLWPFFICLDGIFAKQLGQRHDF